MNTTLRYIIATVAGLCLAFLLGAGIEAIGHKIYPPPPGLDFHNAEQMRNYIRDLPLGPLLFVLLAWLDAVFAGGLVAALVARAHPFRFAGVVGAVFLLAAIATMLMFPHPLWFIITAVLGIPFSSFLAGCIAKRLAQKAAGPH